MSRIVTGGYCGYHQGNFLRSSYEYIYCRILEAQKLLYTVEEERYDLGYRIYIPDFHIYDGNKLLSVVEIKSGNRNEINKAVLANKALYHIYNLPTKILLKKDLEELCVNNNLDFKELELFWKRTSEGRNSMVGDKNPRFNILHIEETLQLISESSIERWKSPSFRKVASNKRIEYFRNLDNRENSRIKAIARGVRQRKLKGIPEIRNIVCKECSTNVSVVHSDRRKIYCSHQCALKNSTRMANKSVKELNAKKHSDILNSLCEEYILDIQAFKQGKRSHIYNTARKVLLKYGLKDIRMFKFIITGKYNIPYKELLPILQDVINKYIKSMPNLQDDKL